VLFGECISCRKFELTEDEIKQIQASVALERKAENARELGLDYEPLEAKDEPVATIDSLEQEIYENTRQFVSLDVMEWMLKRYYTTPPQQEAKDEPVKLRRGDILRCNESDELCTVWATSTSGKTLVKWKDNDFGNYTAEQIGELFWIEPKEEDEPDYKALWQQMCERCDELDKKLTQRKPLTDEEIRKWWASENGLEDCDMCKIDDFILVARAIEAKLKEKNT
jgi:hypothetical protein